MTAKPKNPGDKRRIPADEGIVGQPVEGVGEQVTNSIGRLLPLARMSSHKSDDDPNRKVVRVAIV